MKTCIAALIELEDLDWKKLHNMADKLRQESKILNFLESIVIKNQIICVGFCFCENNEILCAPLLCFNYSSGYIHVVVVIFRCCLLSDNGSELIDYEMLFFYVVCPL